MQSCFRLSHAYSLPQKTTRWTRQFQAHANSWNSCQDTSLPREKLVWTTNYMAWMVTMMVLNLIRRKMNCANRSNTSSILSNLSWTVIHSSTTLLRFLWHKVSCLRAIRWCHTDSLSLFRLIKRPSTCWRNMLISLRYWPPKMQN